MKKITIHFTVNHEPVTVEVEPNHRLIDVLRNNLGLTSVKEGCSEGECGACTVIYNGEPVTSCCILAGQADGADIITLEGVSKDGQPDVVQQAFMDAGAVQCGFCIPGMILTACLLYTSDAADAPAMPRSMTLCFWPLPECAERRPKHERRSYPRP